MMLAAGQIRPTAWIVIGVVVLAAMFFWSRR
jgi:hypothetical protein